MTTKTKWILGIIPWMKMKTRSTKHLKRVKSQLYNVCLFREEPVQKPSGITLCSLNIENVKMNPLPLSRLLDTCTIVCIQEHWLCHFEHHKISDIPYCHQDSQHSTPLGITYDVHIKCSYEHNPHQSSYMPRWSGGVASIWPKSISHYIILDHC